MNRIVTWKPSQPALILSLLGAALPAGAERIWQENGTGYVVMEAENTESDLGKCWKETKPPGYTGKSALEHTCNNPSLGPAQQPLKYTFRIRDAGEYSLHLHIYKNLQGEEKDKCNDVYIKVEGDFTAGAGSPSLNDLKTNNKHYGGDHTKSQWSGDKPIDAHEKKWAAKYVFKAGQTYTLTMSGRAQRANINRLVLTTAAAKAKGQDPSTPESPGNPTGISIAPPDGRASPRRLLAGRERQGTTLVGVDGRVTAVPLRTSVRPAAGMYLQVPGLETSSAGSEEGAHAR